MLIACRVRVRKLKIRSSWQPAEQQYGQSIGTIRSGQAVGAGLSFCGFQRSMSSFRERRLGMFRFF